MNTANDKPTVLLVEDDARLANLIQEYLQKHGLYLKIEPRGDHAEARVARDRPDLVILDVMLPGKDGFTICRQLRPEFEGGIIMLTARDEDLDELLGLELGADDYIRKPVEPRLLLARIQAVLRRYGHRSYLRSRSIEVGNLHISWTSQQALLDNRPLDLTTAEFELLALLASHAGTILSRDQILQHTRGFEYDGADRSIDLRISRLRKKLNDDPRSPTKIKTIRGKGYLVPLPIETEKN